MKPLNYFLFVAMAGAATLAHAQNAPLPDPPSDVQMREARPVQPIMPGMVPVGAATDASDANDADSQAAAPLDGDPSPPTRGSSRYYPQADVPGGGTGDTENHDTALSKASHGSGSDIIPYIEEEKS